MAGSAFLARPGRDFTVDATSNAAAAIVTHTFLTHGLRLKTPAGQLPATLRYGHACADVFFDASGGSPLTVLCALFGFLPGMRKHSVHRMSVRIHVLKEASAGTVLRVDCRPHGVYTAVVPVFLGFLDEAAAALHEQGHTVELGELTDSALRDT